MMKAVDELWSYTGEMFKPVEFEKKSKVDFLTLKDNWREKVKMIFEEAGLVTPEKTFMQTGGKEGIHTENLGLLLTELQYMQKTYPGCEW